jgi:PHD/YefM family antitoxin component YafN of YafNO toxin-antitoxin module
MSFLWRWNKANTHPAHYGLRIMRPTFSGGRSVVTHKPITIKGKNASAVLVSEQDWESIQETLYLLSVPGMRESVREGLQTPKAECSEEPGW